MKDVGLRIKDVGLRIRVQRELREKFLEACRMQDKPAAQVLREFMRLYVAEHGAESGSGPDHSEGAANKSKVRGGKAAP